MVSCQEHFTEPPCVTVALSVYNVEAYIREALDCIIGQTYRDLEILCIDDCSKDKTFDIIKEYATVDSRIRVIRQDKNQGLSVSRNLAIQEAMGDYILMLDGDDLFALDLVEKALNKAKETGADIVMWDFCSFYNEKDLPMLISAPSDLINFNPKDKISLLRRPAFTWVKLIRTSKLRQLNVRFPEGMTKQDIPVWWQLVTSVERIAILPERLSYYRQNPTNTTSRKDKSVFSLAYVMDVTGEYLKKSGLYDAYKNEFLRCRLNLLQGMYDYIKPEYKAEALNLIQKRFDEESRTYIYSHQCDCSSRTLMFFKGYFCENLIEKIKYNSLIKFRSLYRLLKR